MWLNGDEGQGPVPFGLAVGRHARRCRDVQGILAALVRRGVTGKGGHVETSLLEALVDFQFEVLTTHLNDGGRLPSASTVRQRPCLSLGALRCLSGEGRLPGDRHDADPEAAPICSGSKPNSRHIATIRRRWFTARDEIKAIIADRIATRDDRRIGWRSSSRPTSGAPSARLAGAACERRLHRARHAADGDARGRRLDRRRRARRSASTAFAQATTRAAPRIGEHSAAIRRGVRAVSDRVVLRGMTWSHPRGYDPMVACSALWKERTGVEVAWDKRSLQDFESFPVEELARQLRLSSSSTIRMSARSPTRIASRRSTCPSRERERGGARGGAASAAPAGATRGTAANGRCRSTRRRRCRPGGPTLSRAPVADLGRGDESRCRQGQGAAAAAAPAFADGRSTRLRPISARPARRAAPGDLIEACGRHGASGAMIAELVAAVDPRCFDDGPDRGVEEDGAAGIGHRLRAADLRLCQLCQRRIPRERGSPSPTSRRRAARARSARRSAAPASRCRRYRPTDRRRSTSPIWIAGDEVQRGPYAAAGGQPGHAAAWEDDAVNARDRRLLPQHAPDARRRLGAAAP